MNKPLHFSLAALLLAGCSLAPAFEKPPVAVPQAFKEDVRDMKDAKSAAWWQKAEKMEAVPRGAWWAIFNDTGLNTLETEAEKNNQSLKAFGARIMQARAVVRVNAPDLLPNLSVTGNAARTRPSTQTTHSFGGTPYNAYSAQVAASYEPDLFGRIRDEDRALKLDADALQASYRSMLLTLQADVAQDYFLLRALDEERRLLRETVKIRERQAGMMKKRYAQGDVSAQDNAHAAADYAQAQADLTGLDRQRANLEHALAILLGKTPAEFSLPETPLAGAPPAIPPGIPSAVLQRRPDIAAAINNMEAANQRIGVARAAFFPNLMLTATAGAESASLGSLFQWSARTWALGQAGGALLAIPVFSNGRGTAEVERARAAYEESVANYRQQALVAFKDVEDALSDQRYLYQQWEQLSEAATQASRATSLVQKRYDLGDVDYFEVVDTQRISLAAERAAVQVRGQRYVATIALIRALGGSWDSVQR